MNETQQKVKILKMVDTYLEEAIEERDSGRKNSKIMLAGMMLNEYKKDISNG